MKIETMTLKQLESKSVKVHLRARDSQATYVITETSGVTPFTFLMYEYSDLNEKAIIAVRSATLREAAYNAIEQYCEDNAEAA